MQLVVLAAGRGSRLPKKYRYSPKCLVRIRNKEIINYNLDFLNKFNNKIIVSGYKKNILKKKLNTLDLNIFITKIMQKQIWFIVFYLQEKK